MNVILGRTFDFNVFKKVGLVGIVSGKGTMPTATISLLVGISVAGLAGMPWTAGLPSILFRIYVSVLMLLTIAAYFRFAVKISFATHHMGVVRWKNEEHFPLSDIQSLVLTYYPSWGIARLRAKGRNKNRTFFIWAPSYERERHALYLDLSRYINERFKVTV